MFSPEESGPDTARRVADEWELPHSCIKVGGVLGTGAFGQVLNGMVSRAMLSHRGLPAKYQTFQNGSDTEGSNSVLVPVAIKMLKGKVQLKMLMFRPVQFCDRPL